MMSGLIERWLFLLAMPIGDELRETAVAIDDNSGSPLAAVAIFEDISPRCYTSMDDARISCCLDLVYISR
jgi:hypothetical protein